MPIAIECSQPIFQRGTSGRRVGPPRELLWKSVPATLRLPCAPSQRRKWRERQRHGEHKARTLW